MDMHRGNDGEKIVKIDEGEGVKNWFLYQQMHSIMGNKNQTPPPFKKNGEFLVANGECFGKQDENGEYVSVEELGKQFSLEKGVSDIRILFEYFLQNGISAEILESCDFMISGALVDTQTQMLTLFRDWVGETPLHYYEEKETGNFIFASTIQTIIQITGAKASDVINMKPGTMLQISEKSDLKETEYSSLQSIPENTEITRSEAAKKLREKLEFATTTRLETSPTGKTAVAFSGGIDSLITAFLLLQSGKFSQENPLPLYTFHCSDFPEDKQSDIFHARNAYKWLKEQFPEMVRLIPVKATKEEIFEKIPTVVASLEDKMDFNVLPAIVAYFVAEKMAEDGHKVAFGGEGADELCGSYQPWGSFSDFSFEEIGTTGFRKKMVESLYKSLPRVSKVMMENGPLEYRSIFLNKEVAHFLLSLPAQIIRSDDNMKKVLVQAFSENIPARVLERQKVRSQDATGITKIMEEYMQKKGIEDSKSLCAHFKSILFSALNTPTIF
ncbi:MAG: asparagine synthase-related protein [Candidatus Peregrinibacteria bacterium]